jgi:hypothetical protein
VRIVLATQPYGRGHRVTAVLPAGLAGFGISWNYHKLFKRSIILALPTDQSIIGVNVGG